MNTDQGSQFTIVAFTGLLLENAIAVSMDCMMALSPFWAQEGDAGGSSEAWIGLTTVAISEPAGITVEHAHERLGFRPHLQSGV